MQSILSGAQIDVGSRPEQVRSCAPHPTEWRNTKASQSTRGSKSTSGTSATFVKAPCRIGELCNEKGLLCRMESGRLHPFDMLLRVLHVESSFHSTGVISSHRRTSHPCKGRRAQSLHTHPILQRSTFNTWGNQKQGLSVQQNTQFGFLREAETS